MASRIKTASLISFDGDSQVVAKVVLWGGRRPGDAVAAVVSVTDRSGDDTELDIPLGDGQSVNVTMKLSDLVRAAMAS